MVFWRFISNRNEKNNCNIDTDSFIIQNKRENFHKDIVDNVGKRYDIPDYKADRPFIVNT